MPDTNAGARPAAAALPHRGGHHLSITYLHLPTLHNLTNKLKEIVELTMLTLLAFSARYDTIPYDASKKMLDDIMKHAQSGDGSNVRLSIIWYAPTRMCTSACTFTHIHTHAHTNTRIFTCTQAHYIMKHAQSGDGSNVHLSILWYATTPMCTSAYTFTHLSTRAHTYTHICLHTRTLHHEARAIRWRL